jgi:cell division protein FtsB
MKELWKEPMEEDGLTLGPEEALQKEIEKSKTLKVDRLRLRDEIEKLKSEKSNLSQKNQKLKDRLTKLENSAPEKTGSSSTNSLVFTLVIGFLALLWFITRN